MAQRVLSISLGSEIIKICDVMLAGKKKVQIFNAIELIIPEGLCDDGLILDPKNLAYVIKQGLEGEDFKAKKLAFTISSRRIANKEATIPYTKPNKIETIVNANAPEYFPIANLEDYCIRYSILEVTNNESVKNYRLSVIAAPYDLIDGYYALAKELGMPIEIMDYTGNSMLQMLKLQTVSGEIDGILQVGAENTVVNIMDGATLAMQRSVPYGRGVLVEAIKQSRNISEEEADYVVTNEYIGNLVEESNEVADAIRTLLSSINRIVEFYVSRNPEKPVSHLYMMGDVLSIKGLSDLFDRELDRDVQIIGALNGVEVKNTANLNDEIASNYMANIGALLAPLNITKKEEVKAKSSNASLPWWILIVAAVAAVAMIASVLIIYNSKVKSIETIKAQIAQYDGIVELQQRASIASQEAQVLSDWYDTTKGPGETLVRFIEDLEENQPGAVAITKLSVKEGDITIEGESYGKPAVAELAIQLKKLDYIDDVSLEYINEEIEDGSATDKFVIHMTISYKNPYGNEEADETVTIEKLDADGNVVETAVIENANELEGGSAR